MSYLGDLDKAIAVVTKTLAKLQRCRAVYMEAGPRLRAMEEEGRTEEARDLWQRLIAQTDHPTVQ